MSKLNEELKAKLVFERSERPNNDREGGSIITISATRDGIYRQYSFLLKNGEEVAKINEEVKNILTHSIYEALQIKDKIVNNHAMTQEEIEKAKRMGL